MGGWLTYLIAVIGLGADAVGLASAVKPYLPRFSLRALRRLRPIRDIEDGCPWAQIPRGRFAFVSPTDLEAVPTNDFADKVSAHQQRPKTYFEIHKLQEGPYQCLVYASEADASKLEQDDPSPHRFESLDLYSQRWSQAPDLVSVPLGVFSSGTYRSHKKGGTLFRYLPQQPRIEVPESKGTLHKQVVGPVSQEEMRILFQLRSRVGEMHETLLSYHRALDEATLEYVLVRLKELRAAGGRLGHHAELQEMIRTLENREGWLLRHLRLDQGRQVHFRSAEEEREARREAEEAYRAFVSTCNDLLQRGQLTGNSQPQTPPGLSVSVDTSETLHLRSGPTEDEASLEVEIDDSMFSTKLDYRQRTT